MSHRLYTTESFIIGGHDAGEGHRYIALFTKEFGLIYAHARSVREERSKLRYHLQNFSCVDVSLVRGRDVWRVTGARERYNFYYYLRANTEKQLVVARLSSLLRRLLAGEEKNEYVFETLMTGCLFLKNNELSADSTGAIECVLALRVLHALGYVGDIPLFERLVTTAHLSRELLETIVPLQGTAVREINRALKVSQL